MFFGWIFPTNYGATDTRLVAQAFYIGIAAILAVFILTFAMAPKARAQDNGHHLTGA